MLNHGVLRRFRRGVANGQNVGFTLIELMVAMMVMLMVMTSVLYFFVGSLKNVAYSKQRQAATALATQAMEQIRALPYETVAKGLDSTDLTDPYISAGVFSYPQGGISEPVQVTSPASTPAPTRGPLSPHQQDQFPDGASGQKYTVRSYVTKGSTYEPSFNITVLVSWTSRVTTRPGVVVQRSSVYSPSGCLSAATHPFSGPCQALFSAQAGLTPSSIEVVSTDGAGKPIVGLGGAKVDLGLPSMSSSLAVEQTTKLAALGTTSSATTDTGSATTTVGGVSASASADTDPSSTSSTSMSATEVQVAGDRSISGSVGDLIVQPIEGDVASSAAAVKASGECIDWLGNAIGNEMPCSSGVVTPSGAPGSIKLKLNGTVPSLASVPEITVASVGAGSAMRSSVHRTANTYSGLCPSAVGMGCVIAGSSRSLGTVTVGALPSGGVMPDGYVGQFAVSGLRESMTAYSGETSAAAIVSAVSASRSGGDLTYWNGSNYSTIDLTAITSNTTASVPPVTATYSTDDASVEIVQSTTFTAGGTTVLPTITGTSPCLTNECSAVGVQSPTLIAKTTYTIAVTTATVTDAPLTSFVVVTDLGALTNRAAWRAAPTS